MCQFAKKLQNSNETKLVALKVELSSQWHLEFLCKKSQSQMESFFFQITFVDTICIHFEMYPMYVFQIIMLQVVVPVVGTCIYNPPSHLQVGWRLLL